MKAGNKRYFLELEELFSLWRINRDHHLAVSLDAGIAIAGEYRIGLGGSFRIVRKSISVVTDMNR